MIEQCQLAPDLYVSRIITGLWQIADSERKGVKLDPKLTSAAIKSHIKVGFTTFDMADHYGSSEIISGEYQKTKPVEEQIQLLTKWVPPPGKVSQKEVRNAVELARQRLQTDTIDLMQYHIWNYANPNWLDCLFWLNELKEEGLIRHIGLTNVDATHLRIALTSGLPIVSNQISFSLLDQRAHKNMTQLCEEFGIKILAFGILAGGFLSEKWIRKIEPNIDHLDTWSQMKYKRYINIIGGWSRFQELLRTLEEIGKIHDVTISTVAAKYMLDQPSVGAIILGSRLDSSDYITENLKISSLQLSQNEKNQISSIIGKFNPIPGNCGDEYRKPPFLTAIGDLSHHLDSIPPPYKSIKAGKGISQVFTGTIWEEMAGFCRAIRKGNRIMVSGTTATHGDKLIGKNDAIAQTNFIIDKIQGAIESLGGKFSDIIHTRVYVQKLEDWEAVALVHGERFKDVLPSNTLVQAGIIGDEHLVEIEAEAEIS